MAASRAIWSLQTKRVTIRSGEVGQGWARGAQLTPGNPTATVKGHVLSSRLENNEQGFSDPPALSQENVYYHTRHRVTAESEGTSESSVEEGSEHRLHPEIK